MKNQKGSTLTSWVICAIFISSILFAKVFDGESAADKLKNSIKTMHQNQQTLSKLS